jgi:hypothetical protein
MNNTDYDHIDFEDEDTNTLEPSVVLKAIINLSVLTLKPLRFIDLSPKDYDALKAEVDNLASELAKGSLFGVRVKSCCSLLKTQKTEKPWLEKWPETGKKAQ